MNFQDFLRQIGLSINSGSNNNDASSSNNSANFSIKKKYIVWVVLIVLAVLTIATSVFIVDETEQSVVLLLGQYNRTASAGLHVKIPFGIERSYNVPTQIVQNMTFGFRPQTTDVVSIRARGDFSAESTMLTGDLNIVTVEWIIQYRIVDPYAWLFNVDNPRKTIYDVSRSIVNELVGDDYITDVLGNARTEIEEKALVSMNELFKQYGLGISLSAVRLQNIVPPEGAVQDAFEDVNKAIQDMNRLINEGREEYNKQIPRAKGDAERLVQVAKGYATERINQSRGDVSRFNAVLTEYQRSPNVTRERLYYETMEEIFSAEDGNTTKFIDSRFQNLIPFLPLAPITPTTQSFSPAN